MAEYFGVPAKPLVAILGEPMVARVARTLATHARIERVIVLGQQSEKLANWPGTEWLAADPLIRIEPAHASVSRTIAEALARHPEEYPFLVVTADHALLDGAMIDAFIDGAGDADVAAALVERDVLLAAYPDSRRTWLNFRGGAYSGANLFRFGSPRALKALELWQRVEGQRKKARAIIGAFGALMLLAAALRILTLHGAMAWAGRRMGLKAVAVEMPMAEACIDVDTPEDHALVTRILSHIRHNSTAGGGA